MEYQISQLDEIKRMETYFFLRKKEVIKYLRLNFDKIDNAVLERYNWR